ncbi:MAG: DUF4367 domain-containing protein [Oscillospiraceae bacterium]|nr:DUF4367 domain-containing protein [Oscillospiraceae bacterium]
MSENIIKSVLEEKYFKEFDVYSNVPNHFFSFRHKRNMKAIFANTSAANGTITRVRFNKQFVTIMVAIIFLAVLSITAVAMAIAGFFTKEHSDNTELFAINYENAPMEIEDIYYISALPIGFEVYSKSETKISITTTYYNQSDDKYIVFSQHTKESFNAHIDNEHGEMTETTVNGYTGLYYADNAGLNILVWDDKDYIFKLSSELAKTETENLAKSTKLLK